MSPGENKGRAGAVVRAAAGAAAVGAAFWAFFAGLSWLLRRCPEPIGSRADMLSAGAWITLKLTVAAGTSGLAIGVAAGLAELSPNRLLRAPAESFVWLIRGTPLLVQILFAYYALPSLVPGLKLDEFSAAALALALNVGAYNAEIVRAGVQSVPRGQSEAAFSLGLSKTQTLCWIVLPQALRLTIPPLINNLVALLKDSSLASAIGLLELTLAGNRISSETFRPVPVLTAIALVYLALTTAITALASVLERRSRAA